jgi:hypothetical protein
MVKQSAILTAINRLIVEAFPYNTVYIQGCPKDFNRPSFMLEYIRLSQRDATRKAIEKTVYFTITCFTPVDKYYRSDMDELANLQEETLQLFSSGYITVGDRALKVQGSTGGMDTDRAYIDLQFEFFDNRTDAEDQTPLMSSVTTRIQEE